MQTQLRKSGGTRLRTQENAYLLNSLMAAIQSQSKNPLAEHKGNTIPTPRDSKTSKFSFNESGMSTYAPKSATAVTLKSYLRKNLNHTTALVDNDPKSKTTINRTHANNANDLTTGSSTQRAKVGLKGSFHNDSAASKEPAKTFRMTHGGVNNKTLSPERAPFSRPEKARPSKNLTINPSAEVSTEALKASQLKCLTARNGGLEPTDLGSNAPLQSAASISIPNYEASKCSLKSNGVVKAYAANTNQGLVRGYNEDRVSIILNILKPASRANETWPKCSFFGVYDGHGGASCADFLRDNLHQFVIKEACFPYSPAEALKKGFEAAERKFLELCQTGGNGEQLADKSGSCAVVALIVGDICYVSNVGDSRAVLSMDGGSKVQPLTNDHKPAEETEQRRIAAAGGQIYQTATQIPANLKAGFGSDMLVGPYRVLPGRLSVSRTFGDPEAKLPKYGGNPNVVVAVPDIVSFKITNDHDFIVMGSDGIFDRLSNKDAVQCVWNTVAQEKAAKVHQQCGVAADSILKNSLLRRSLDNVTSVIIAFPRFKHTVFPKVVARKTKASPADSKRPPSTRPSARISDSKPLTARNKSAQREPPKLGQTITNPATIPARRSDVSTKGNHQQTTASFLSRIAPQSTRDNKKRFEFTRPRLLLADSRKLHA